MKNERASLSLVPGTISFFDSYTPSLEDGTYTVSVQSGLPSIGDAASYFANPIQQQFKVAGARFTLLDNDLHATYPPSNSVGDYNDLLPHVVLNRREIPWERKLTIQNVPWICLLIFTEDECRSSIQQTSIQNLLSPQENIRKPNINSTGIETEVCNSIIIPLSLFRAIAPRQSELSYLAHVRCVDPSNQVVDPSPDDEEKGWFSLVVGNRLLLKEENKAVRYYAHLVSLEGVEDCLDPNAKITEQNIQLVSLYNWSFSVQNEGASFRDLTANLVKGSSAESLLFRYSHSQPINDPLVDDRLKQGYIALPYETATGEETFAWYRGPFSPVVSQPFPCPLWPSSSSSLMIYDSTNGIFDQTYAAAWSLGRALAISDGTFSQALLRLRRQSHRTLTKMKQNRLDNQLTELSDEQFISLTTDHFIRDKFAEMLKDDLGVKLNNLFSSPFTPTERAVKKKENIKAISHAEITQTLLKNNSVLQLLKKVSEHDLDLVTSWLADKRQLIGIPFNHLIPHEEMLPKESVRFFYIDNTWIDMFVSGALSIGIEGTRDLVLQQALKDMIEGDSRSKVKETRAALLGKRAEETDGILEPSCGLLLRSELVSGWPGLEIAGYLRKKDEEEEETPVKIVRMDRLSPNVLLLLFSDIPARVTISEPPQHSFVFGIEDDFIDLRSLDQSDLGQLIQPAKQFPANGGFSKQFYRTSTGTGIGVLNINANNGGLVKQMQKNFSEEIRSANLTIQMVRTPEQLQIIPEVK